jgi:hypothetical protein
MNTSTDDLYYCTDSTDVNGNHIWKKTGAVLPTPTSSTLGGVKSISNVSHTWLSDLKVDGTFDQTQPSTSDLSTSAADGRIFFALGGQQSSDSDLLFNLTTDSLNGSRLNLKLGSDVFANIVTANVLSAVNGTIIYCSDCDTPVAEGNVCSSAGDKAGAEAHYIRTGWRCF